MDIGAEFTLQIARFAQDRCSGRPHSPAWRLGAIAIATGEAQVPSCPSWTVVAVVSNAVVEN